MTPILNRELSSSLCAALSPALNEIQKTFQPLGEKIWDVATTQITAGWETIKSLLLRIFEVVRPYLNREAPVASPREITAGEPEQSREVLRVPEPQREQRAEPPAPPRNVRRRDPYNRALRELLAIADRFIQAKRLLETIFSSNLKKRSIMSLRIDSSHAAPINSEGSRSPTPLSTQGLKVEAGSEWMEVNGEGSHSSEEQFAPGAAASSPSLSRSRRGPRLSIRVSSSSASRRFLRKQRYALEIRESERRLALLTAESERRIAQFTAESEARIRNSEAGIRNSEASIRDSEARIRESEARIREIEARTAAHMQVLLNQLPSPETRTASIRAQVVQVTPPAGSLPANAMVPQITAQGENGTKELPLNPVGAAMGAWTGIFWGGLLGGPAGAVLGAVGMGGFAGAASK